MKQKKVFVILLLISLFLTACGNMTEEPSNTENLPATDDAEMQVPEVHSVEPSPTPVQPKSPVATDYTEFIGKSVKDTVDALGRSYNVGADVLDSVYRKYMESAMTVIFANLLTYHTTDLCKFTYYYLIFEIVPFGKMRKSLEFL